MDRYLGSQRYDGVILVPSPETAEWLSLGHRRALADLFWMKGLIYVGEELTHQGDSQFVYDLAHVVIGLDPEFRRVYLWAGVAGLYRAQDVQVEQMMPAVDILRDAARRFPDDGEIAWELGATLRYEIAPLVHDAELRHSLEQEASAHLITAARLGSGPPWLALTATSDLTLLGELDRAAAHLREMIPLVDDADLRDELLGRLGALEGQAQAEALRLELERSAEAAARDFPWLPPSFSTLLGPRVVAGP